MSGSSPDYVVAGGGTLVTAVGRSTYAFRASVDGGGEVKGQVEIHFSSVPWRLHGRVTCLVVDGNEAWGGAVITRSNATSQAWQVGRTFVWRAQDNGEGEDAAPDRIRFAARPAEECNQQPMFPLIEWTNGDVQINSLPAPSPPQPGSRLCSDPSSDGTATFTDSNLEAAVRSALGIGPTDDLTCAQVAGLIELLAVDQGITSLEGIQNLTGLEILILDVNEIGDISPLDGLTSLRVLGLNANTISDISPITGLTSLTELGLNENAITDIDPLVGLTSLRLLTLAWNGITDISALSGLRELTDLAIESNAIVDISALSDLTNLTNLQANDNAITDLSALYDLTNLRDLGVARNAITDITVLSRLTNLQTLNAFVNAITDIGPLGGLAGLTYLQIGDNAIDDIGVLSGLPGLTVLALYGNSITDVDALSALTGLTVLDLSGNSITDVGAMRGLTGLRELYLFANVDLSDIQPLFDNADSGGLGVGDVVGLDATSVSCVDVDALRARGVTVFSSCP